MLLPDLEASWLLRWTSWKVFLIPFYIYSMQKKYPYTWKRDDNLRIILISWVSVWYPWKRLVISHISIPHIQFHDFYNQSFRHLNMRWSDSKNDKQRRIFAIDACKCYECVISGIGQRTFSYLYMIATLVVELVWHCMSYQNVRNDQTLPWISNMGLILINPVPCLIHCKHFFLYKCMQMCHFWNRTTALVT